MSEPLALFKCNWQIYPARVAAIWQADRRAVDLRRLDPLRQQPIRHRHIIFGNHLAKADVHASAKAKISLPGNGDIKFRIWKR